MRIRSREVVTVQEWWECPEAAGPQTEGAINGVNYGDPGYPSIGQPPRQLSIEQRDRERAEADRKWAIRQRVEAAATAISISAMEGRTMTDQILAEAAAAAQKAALR